MTKTALHVSFSLLVLSGYVGTAYRGCKYAHPRRWEGAHGPEPGTTSGAPGHLAGVLLASSRTP